MFRSMFTAVLAANSLFAFGILKTTLAPEDVVKAAAEFAETAPKIQNQIFLVESFKIGEVLHPAFLLSLEEEKPWEFDLKDGNYVQWTMKRQDDGSFSWDKQHKPQVIRQGKFLNAAADVTFTFSSDTSKTYALLLKEVKKGQVIYKNAGGAVDPKDVAEDQSVVDLLTHAAQRELEEEAFGSKDMMAVLTLGGVAKIGVSKKINMNTELVRIPDAEFNKDCIASATVAWHIVVEGDKEAYLEALRAQLGVEVGTTVTPEIVDLPWVQAEAAAKRVQLRRAKPF